MSDEVKGLAVLDDRGNPPILFATGVPAANSGRNKFELVRIPMRPRGTPRTKAKEWEYDIQGDEIHVTPSVRISVNIPQPGQEDKFPEVFREIELFHNGGDWRVRFVLWSAAADKLPDDHPWDYWRRHNAAILGDA
jgi:hypothetical protein